MRKQPQCGWHNSNYYLNVFVKPNERCRACSDIVMARKRTFEERKRTFSLSQMNNVELARTLSWRELEIANTELWAKWKGKTHFSRNEKKERFIQANIGFYSKPTCHAKAFLHST